MFSGHFTFSANLAKLYWNLVISLQLDFTLLVQNLVKNLKLSARVMNLYKVVYFFPDILYVVLPAARLTCSYWCPRLQTRTLQYHTRLSGRCHKKQKMSGSLPMTPKFLYLIPSQGALGLPRKCGGIVTLFLSYKRTDGHTRLLFVWGSETAKAPCLVLGSIVRKLQET